MLFVDAEGHDDDVLIQYPFHTHPPWRVVFEPKHLSVPRCQAAGQLLRSHGYECLEAMDNRSVPCNCRGGASTWHLLSSNEPVDFGTPLWNATPVIPANYSA